MSVNLEFNLDHCIIYLLFTYFAVSLIRVSPLNPLRPLSFSPNFYFSRDWKIWDLHVILRVGSYRVFNQSHKRAPLLWEMNRWTRVPFPLGSPHTMLLPVTDHLFSRISLFSLLPLFSLTVESKVIISKT